MNVVLSAAANILASGLLKLVMEVNFENIRGNNVRSVNNLMAENLIIKVRLKQFLIIYNKLQQKMKKNFSIIATAVALVMGFTSCEKEEKNELVDPLAGNHVVETEIHAEISGAFTKAFAFKVGYTDFDGNTDTVMVNGNFDGENATFDKKFLTKVSDKETEASVNIKTFLGDLDTYKSELSPWNINYYVVVRVDGNEIKRYAQDEKESMSGIAIFDPVNGHTYDNWALNAYNIFKDMFGENGDKDFVISVGSKGTNCELK